MRFLLSFGTFVLCVGILAFGAYSTITGIQVDAMVDEISAAFSEGPLFPEFPEDDRPDDSYTPGGDTQNPGDDTQNPGDDTQNPGDDTQNPGDDTQNPGDDTQNPGGDTQTPGGDTQNPGDDTQNPGGNEEPPKEDPAPPTLSTEAAKDSFRDLYENHDPDFADIKKEMLTDMITGLLGGGNGGSNGGDTPTEPEEPEEPDDGAGGDFGADMNFGTEFNPEDFEPEGEPEEDESEGETTNLDGIITEVMNSYVDNLFAAIEDKKESAAEATEEEKEAIKEEFVQKEAEAVAGLVNIAGNAGSDIVVAGDVVKESVNAILGSDVCMNTVTQVVVNNEAFTEQIQEATDGLTEETKVEIQNKIESSLNDFRASESYSEEDEQKYRDLAELFGITLSGGAIPNFPG